MKRILALATALVMACALLSGCSGDDLALYNAIQKDADITAYRSKTEISYDVTIEEPFEYPEAWDKVELLLNNLTAAFDIAYAKDGDDIRMQTSFEAKLPDMSLQANTWMQLGNNARTVIQIPFLVRLMLPQEYASKQYLWMDQSAVNTATLAPEMVEQIVALSWQITDKLPINKPVVHSMVEEGALRNYTVVLTSSDLMTILADWIQAFASDAELRNLYKEFMMLYTDMIVSSMPELDDASDSMTGIMVADTAPSKEDWDQMFAEMEPMLPLVSRAAKSICDELAATELFGKGLTMVYGVNAAGIIERTKVTLPIRLDMEKLATMSANMDAIMDALTEDALPDTNGDTFVTVMMGDMLPEPQADSADAFLPEASPYQYVPTGVAEITLHVTEQRSDINGDVSVTLPTVTEENSIEYGALMKQIAEEAKWNNWSLLFDDETIAALQGKPITVVNETNGRSAQLVPYFEPLAEETPVEEAEVADDDAYYYYDESLRPMYLPLRELMELLDLDVTWDDTLQGAILGDQSAEYPTIALLPEAYSSYWEVVGDSPLDNYYMLSHPSDYCFDGDRMVLSPAALLYFGSTSFEFYWEGAASTLHLRERK